MGCLLSSEELYNALAEFQCDKTDGRFHVDGNIASLLGAGSEFIIDDNAVYYVQGKPFSLRDALAHSNYGLQCVVIA